jgi:3-oxoacyl-[acyl-carrier-protein] synthase III
MSISILIISSVSIDNGLEIRVEMAKVLNFCTGKMVKRIVFEIYLQANQRIIDSVATRLHFPPERVISNLANYGNTSAASIPLALDEAVRSGKVKPGHTIATSGFGAGLTWGSAIMRWR